MSEADEPVRRRVRYLSWPLALIPLLLSCERSEPAEVVAECTPNSFRACELDACRGAQQCEEPGTWSDCACTVTDATFPDASPDAQGDAADDADGS